MGKSGGHMKASHIAGTAAPGFEAVRATFAEHVAADLEDGAQCCVYHRGRKVVDLWTEPGQYTARTVQNLFSSTKVITSIVVAMLADRGHLSYDQRVSELWPEYAQHGKGETTIAQVMRHEAGLSNFDQPLNASLLTAEQIKAGSVSDIIAAQEPAHIPGERRQYHAVTRGYIVNEIVRRADPAGRTVGQFLREEIAAPLQIEDQLAIGLQENFDNVRDLTFTNAWWTWRQLIRPTFLGGGKVPCSNTKIRGAILAGLPVVSAYRAIKRLTSTANDAPLISVDGWEPNQDGPLGDDVSLFNTPVVRRAEVPSANGHGSARALAVVAATMVEGGQLGNNARLISAEGIEAAHGSPDRKEMFGETTVFTNAGWAMSEGDREGWVGWMGLGGSVVQWHPQERVGFAYAINKLEWSPNNERGLRLQQSVIECAQHVDLGLSACDGATHACNVTISA